MKKKLLALLAKKEARKAEIVAKAATTEDVKELRALNTELDGVNTEIAELQAAIDEIPDERGAGDPPATPPAAPQPVGRSAIFASYGMKDPSKEEREALIQKYETRGADLKAKKAIVVALDETAEERATTLASGTLITEKKYSQTLNGTFNDVSGLVDLVGSLPLDGGESYTKGFEKPATADADYTTETGDYNNVDPVTDYVEIVKAKITDYSEITDEATKLPNINYQALVVKNVRNAIRRKMTKQIIAGAGGANAIVGIFNAPVNVIPLASDLEISEIDADTLDTIVFGYGGDEDVEGANYLILNKDDLAAFAAIRNAAGDKLYEIEVNGNTGTISSKGSFKVPFVINSICPALSAAGTADNTYCMAYGKLATYEMPIFSGLTIEESRDYKFKSGQICYRGSIWVGGNVAAYKGFTRIKKVAAV